MVGKLYHGCFRHLIKAEVIATGWGRSEIPLTPALREGNVTIVPFSQCIKRQNSSLVYKHQICTRYVNGTHADEGDSGGPIFQLREKGNIYSGYVQVGVANRLENNEFVAYADVAAYAGWIHRRISDCGNHRFQNKFHSNLTVRPPQPTRPRP